MYKLSNDEICFISIILEQGLDNISKDKQSVSIKKEIMENLFRLEDLNSEKRNLREKLEKYTDKYDKIFYSYLDEKEEFVTNIFNKLSSMYEIIKENDVEAFEKANYFITDKPLIEMRSGSKNNEETNED